MDKIKTFRGLRAQNRRKITDSILEEVARVYRDNRDSGAPTKAVADYLHLAPSTASLYVKRARQAGALDPLPERDGGDDHKGLPPAAGPARRSHTPPTPRGRN